MTLWSSFTWWLYHDPNAPGVMQTFTAIFTVILTGVLIVVTARYTQLTQLSVKIAAEMAATAAKQLAASAQPKLAISFRGHTFVSGNHNAMVCSDATVTNVGDAPVKLRRMMAGVIGTSAPLALGDVPVPYGLVLMPKEPFTNKLQLDTGTKTVNQQAVFPTVIVDCSDLAEVSEHSFRFDEVEGLRHSLGFK